MGNDPRRYTVEDLLDEMGADEETRRAYLEHQEIRGMYESETNPLCLRGSVAGYFQCAGVVHEVRENPNACRLAPESMRALRSFVRRARLGGGR
ncbi:MAG: hypothetical protein FJZ04_01570 [Candidatus Moranbacteria bacterium]|nr:hypothetical protein [Candidatus Moranbacteria bacterium]